jgi:hypothetical protein
VEGRALSSLHHFIVALFLQPELSPSSYPSPILLHVRYIPERDTKGGRRQSFSTLSSSHVFVQPFCKL